MRKSLFTAAAVAPLLACAAVAGAARADTTISTPITTPIRTSTANNGAADNVIISASGTIILTGGGVGVTIDSDNFLTNGGVIQLNDADNSTGVLIVAPLAGDLTNNSNIILEEDYTPADTNNDGIPDGPVAEGANKYGVRVMGDGVYNGNITNTGRISVEGNNSYGISVESQMVGDLDLSGVISIVGKDSTGIRTTQSVTGDVKIESTIVAAGENVTAISIGGDISESLRIYSNIQITGYSLPTRPNNPAVIEGLLPSNLLQAGPAIIIAGDVAGGVFFGSPPREDDDDPNDTDDTDEDEDDDGDGVPDRLEDNDKDGIPDVDEGTASISMFGSAPAIRIGATGDNVHLGVFGEAENAYGFIMRGGITASGVYDNISATAVQFGVAGGTVAIDGGVRITGGITSTAIKANATSLHFLSGTTAPEIRIEGGVSALTAGNVDEGGTPQTANVVLIEQGATVNRFTNSGSVVAQAASDTASASAVVDRAGTLSTIVNTGSIQSSVAPITEGVVASGRAIAFDLRANTTGVSFTQSAFNDGDDDATNNVPTRIAGDILLGSGQDTVHFGAGSVTGALDYASGGGSLLIDGGAVYRGALTTNDAIAINVTNGTLEEQGGGAIKATSLNVGDDGKLVVAIDPNTSSSTNFQVSGAATVSQNAEIGVNILSLPQAPQSYTVVSAGSLNLNGDITDQVTQVPYLFVAGANADQAAGTITVDVRRRSAEEAGLNQAQAAAYDQIYAALPSDDGIQSAFLDQFDQSGLVGVMEQMLPDHAGGVARSLSWAQEAAGRAAADWAHSKDQVGPTRAWTQEIGFGENKDRGDASAWRIYGFGSVAGVESVSADGDALGVALGFSTANVSNPDTIGDDLVGVSQITAGGYWRGVYGGLHADVQAGAGYVWANNRREFLYVDADGTVVNRSNESDWNGYSLYARAGLAYELNMGDFVLVPATHLDYFRLYESGYTEEGGGDGFDLDVESRTSDILSSTTSLTMAYEFGGSTKIRPELEFGWRHILAGKAGSTTASFLSGGLPFVLPGERLKGGAPIVRFGLRAYARYFDLKLDAGAEFRDEYTDLDVRLTLRIVL